MGHCFYSVYFIRVFLQTMFCFPVQDLMAMDTIFATLACCLLALLCVVAQTGKGNLIIPTIANIDLSSPTNMTHVTETATPPNSTVHVTVISNLTDNTTPFPSTTRNNETFATTTLATTESTSPLQTSQSTAIMTPLTNSTSPTTEKPGTHTPTFTAITTPAMDTTVGYISTSDTAVITANSSSTVNTTSHSLDRATQGKQQVSCFIYDFIVHCMLIFNTYELLIAFFFPNSSFAT